MRFLKVFFGVIFCIASFSYVVIAIVEKQPLWLIATAACLVFAILLFRKTKKDKAHRKTTSTPTFQEVRRSFVHATGLPVATGVLCELYLTKTGLEIFASGTKFNIIIDKILSISTKTDTEIQNNTQYVSSAGGALAGAMLFGVPGAIIGGRAKKKKTTTTTHKNFMVITYKKNKDIDYIVFTLKGTPMDAMPFITNFGILDKDREKETIDL